jgi:ATP-binding cassette subfamily B (MDR/TAP) protein 1
MAVDSCNGGAAAEGSSKKDEKKRPEQSVAFYELFSFADKWDRLLMAAGSLGAVVHGAAMPVFFLLFGELINGFGKNQMHLRKMTDEVSKASIRSY